MKKHLYLMPVLALSMAAFALAGCDDKKEQEAGVAPAATEEVVAESAMPAATDATVTATINASDAVAYATALGSTNGAVFVTLQNPQAASDSLTGASTDVSESVEIHETTTATDGTVSMSKVTAIEIMPGQHIRLAPDSFHLMLINLKSPLSEGQTFNVTLNFTNAGAVTVPVTVVAAGTDTSATTDEHEGHDATEATVPVDETPVTETTDEAPAAAEETTPAPATDTTAPAAPSDATTAE